MIRPFVVVHSIGGGDLALQGESLAEDGGGDVGFAHSGVLARASMVGLLMACCETFPVSGVSSAAWTAAGL